MPGVIRSSENRVIGRDSGFRKYALSLFIDAAGTRGSFIYFGEQKYLPWQFCERRLSFGVDVKTSEEGGTLEKEGLAGEP